MSVLVWEVVCISYVSFILSISFTLSNVLFIVSWLWMKKILLLISFIILFWYCFAETWVEYVDVKMDANKLQEANADLSQIEIDFCDKEGEKAIEYTLAPGWVQDICYKTTNHSDKDIVVTVGFVDGTFTNDQRKNKACKQQWEIQEFGQYVTWYAETFTVEANNIVYQHAKLHVPEINKSKMNGCLVYYTQGVEMGGQMNFTVLMRKAKFIDITLQPKVKSPKSKVRWLIFGIIILLLFFTKIRNKPKKLPKK